MSNGAEKPWPSAKNWDRYRKVHQRFHQHLFSSLVGIAFLLWYAITRHWALIPVFFIGVLILGGLTEC